jgi:hypothetical protein
VYVRVVRCDVVGAENVALAALTFPDFRCATATLDATRAAIATTPSQVIRFMSRLPESIGVPRGRRRRHRRFPADHAVRIP